MEAKYLKPVLLACLAVLLLAACGAPGRRRPHPDPAAASSADINIVSEGRVVPVDTVELAFFSSGLVTEVLVEEVTWCR